MFSVSLFGKIFVEGHFRYHIGCAAAVRRFVVDAKKPERQAGPMWRSCIRRLARRHDVSSFAISSGYRAFSTSYRSERQRRDGSAASEATGVCARAAHSSANAAGEK